MHVFMYAMYAYVCVCVCVYNRMTDGVPITTSDPKHVLHTTATTRGQKESPHRKDECPIDKVIPSYMRGIPQIIYT